MEPTYPGVLFFVLELYPTRVYVDTRLYYSGKASTLLYCIALRNVLSAIPLVLQFHCTTRQGISCHGLHYDHFVCDTTVVLLIRILSSRSKHASCCRVRCSSMNSSTLGALGLHDGSAHDPTAHSSVKSKRGSMIAVCTTHRRIRASNPKPTITPPSDWLYRD